MGESLAANATGFPAAILQMTPIERGYLRFLGPPSKVGRCVLTRYCSIGGLLRLRAGCVENRLEHIERLDADLAVCLRVERQTDNIARGNGLLFSIDVDGDVFVRRRADQPNGQSSGRNDHRLVRLDVV